MYPGALAFVIMIRFFTGPPPSVGLALVLGSKCQHLLAGRAAGADVAEPCPPGARAADQRHGQPRPSCSRRRIRSSRIRARQRRLNGPQGLGARDRATLTLRLCGELLLAGAGLADVAVPCLAAAGLAYPLGRVRGSRPGVSRSGTGGCRRNLSTPRGSRLPRTHSGARAPHSSSAMALVRSRGKSGSDTLAGVHAHDVCTCSPTICPTPTTSPEPSIRKSAGSLTPAPPIVAEKSDRGLGHGWRKRGHQ
jgi:hypothetical protein